CEPERRLSAAERPGSAALDPGEPLSLEYGDGRSVRCSHKFEAPPPTRSPPSEPPSRCRSLLPLRGLRQLLRFFPCERSGDFRFGPDPLVGQGSPPQLPVDEHGQWLALVALGEPFHLLLAGFGEPDVQPDLRRLVGGDLDLSLCDVCTPLRRLRRRVEEE